MVLVFLLSKSYLHVFEMFFWYLRKSGMSGGRERAWMRFWDKDFDRWRLLGAGLQFSFLSLVHSGVLSHVA